MKKIYIKTTEVCQLHCDHCYIGENRNLQGFFNEDKTISWLREYIQIFNINERDILFSFHGGEPFLCQLNKMQKVVDAFPNASYDATSNLCFSLTQDKLNFIKQNFIDKYGDNKPFIKTSWDYEIRFQSWDEQFLWDNNVKTLLSEGVNIRVVICLTSILVNNIIPFELLSYMKTLGIKDINFERLTTNTTANKSLIPDYDRQDEWLLQFYDIADKRINVGLFEELKHASNYTFINCRRRHCMMEVVTINANGTIGGCPNSSIDHFYTDIENSPMEIFQNCKRKELIKSEQTNEIECYSCELFPICNGDCHQLSWQNGVCPAPKKLIRRIKDDLEREKKISLFNS